MEITYWTFIGLVFIGIVSGIVQIIKDKFIKGNTPRRKRELQSSIFFTFVMFTTSLVSIYELGFSFIFILIATFFVVGLFMINHSVKRMKSEEYNDY